MLFSVLAEKDMSAYHTPEQDRFKKNQFVSNLWISNNLQQNKITSHEFNKEGGP